jgi:hypothetical protein
VNIPCESIQENSTHRRRKKKQFTKSRRRGSNAGQQFLVVQSGWGLDQIKAGEIGGAKSRDKQKKKNSNEIASSSTTRENRKAIPLYIGSFYRNVSLKSIYIYRLFVYNQRVFAGFSIK